MGAIDNPLHPLSIAIGCEATFVARSIDVEHQAPGRGAEAGRRAPRHGVRRGLPELQRLQRRRLGLRHRPRHEGRHDARAGARQAADLRQEPRQGHPPQRHGPGSRRAGQGHHRGRPAVPRREGRPSRAWPTCSAGCGTRSFPEPIGVFRGVERPIYEQLVESQLRESKAKQGPGDLQAMFDSGDTWVVRSAPSVSTSCVKRSACESFRDR